MAFGVWGQAIWTQQVLLAVEDLQRGVARKIRHSPLSNKPPIQHFSDVIILMLMQLSDDTLDYVPDRLAPLPQCRRCSNFFSRDTVAARYTVPGVVSIGESLRGSVRLGAQGPGSAGRQ